MFSYDSTSGALIGLSNTGNATANVALLTFTPRAQINTITDYTTSGTGLSSEQYSYDANLRATGATATWLSGSGSSGTILSQSKTYDPSSNVTSLSTTLAAVPGVSGSGGSETQNYCYDEQNRLVWAGNSGTQPGAGNGTCGSGTLANSLTGAGYSASYVYTHLGQLWQGPQGNSSTSSQYLYCDSSHPHQLTGLYSLGATCGAAPTSRRWHSQTDASFLTLALANGVIYTAGSRFTSPTGSGSISALRASDGSPLWHVSVGSPGLSTPLVVNGVLYVASILDGMVYALRVSDGSLLWHATTGSPWLDLSSPLVVNGVVYVEGASDGRVYALRASTGALFWQAQTGTIGAVLSSPLVSNGLVYVVNSGDGSVYALRASDGTVRWRYSLGQPDPGVVLPMVVGS